MNEQNIDFYTKSEINAMLNGLSFIKISEAAYKALVTPDPDTVYYVYDEEGNITQYFGTAKMSSGTIPAVTRLIANTTPTPIIGNAEMEE